MYASPVVCGAVSAGAKAETGQNTCTLMETRRPTTKLECTSQGNFIYIMTPKNRLLHYYYYITPMLLILYITVHMVNKIF